MAFKARKVQLVQQLSGQWVYAIPLKVHFCSRTQAMSTGNLHYTDGSLGLPCLFWPWLVLWSCSVNFLDVSDLCMVVVIKVRLCICGNETDMTCSFQYIISLTIKMLECLNIHGVALAPWCCDSFLCCKFQLLLWLTNISARAFEYIQMFCLFTTNYDKIPRVHQ